MITLNSLCEKYYSFNYQLEKLRNYDFFDDVNFAYVFLCGFLSGLDSAHVISHDDFLKLNDEIGDIYQVSLVEIGKII